MPIFFKRPISVALRELSLRQAAHRLHQDVEAARRVRADVVPWATTERILVCVGPSPSSARIIRTAKRMAAAFGAEWMAVAVTAGGDGQLASAIRERTSTNLELAEQLGAETHTLIGRNVAAAVLGYAQSRNITKIIAGKTAQPWWKRVFLRTVVEELLEHSGDIDVYVITGETADTPIQAAPALQAAPIQIRSYVATAAVMAICGVLGWLSHFWHLSKGTEVGSEANIAMVFLAGVALVATRFGRGPAVAASIIGVLVFDFFFVPPYRTFAIRDSEYLITFAVMLGIGLLISTLAARQRSQLRAAQEQEQRTAKLFRMTRQLSELSGTEFLLQTAGKQLKEFFGGEIVVYLRDSDDSLSLRLGNHMSIAQFPTNEIVARWVADHNQMAGLNTDTLPNATALFVPLVGSQRTIGALGVRPDDLARFRDPEQRRLLETCASLTALSIERDQSVLEAEDAQLRMQTEQLRNSLLSSVSHDLRTPLAAIAGTAANLQTSLQGSTKPHEREMLQTLVNQSHQLVRLVENLLDMAKLESGSTVLNRQWHVMEELVGSALVRVRAELTSHQVSVRIPELFPLAFVDGFLLEQAFVNLLENASRYTPSGTDLEISAKTIGNRIEIRFADKGPGLSPGTETKVFDKFFRGTTATPDGRRGVGLGLAICQGIVQAHGGTISASNRASGGAEFVISLSCKQQSPQAAVAQSPSLAES